MKTGRRGRACRNRGSCFFAHHTQRRVAPQLTMRHEPMPLRLSVSAARRGRLKTLFLNSIVSPHAGIRAREGVAPMCAGIRSFHVKPTCLEKPTSAWLMLMHADRMSAPREGRALFVERNKIRHSSACRDGRMEPEQVQLEFDALVSWLQADPPNNILKGNIRRGSHRGMDSESRLPTTQDS